MIYYNEKGEVDKLATYLNNHDWCIPVIFTLCVLIGAFVEGM